MVKRIALIGTLTLVLGAVALPAYAQTHVSIGIGTPFYGVPVAPVGVVPVAPYPGYIWQPAHYVWTAYGYQLVPGTWVAAPYYAPGYYAPRYYARRAYGAPSVVVAPGLGFGLNFNVGHGGHAGHGGHGHGHGRH